MGRKKGYRQNLDAKRAAYRKAEEELQSYRHGVGEPYGKLEDLQNKYNEAQQDYHREQSTAPDAPFKTSWSELAFKRMLRYAAENGMTASWLPGQEQVDRYAGALKKAVDTIHWSKTPDGVHIQAIKDGKMVADTNYKEDVLTDAIGKQMGEKIIKSSDQNGTLTDNDLSISDTGMAGFYDKILPSIANKLGKKYGTKVGETTIGQNKRHKSHIRKINRRLSRRSWW